MSSVTPYAAAGIVNDWLKADGVQKELPPQMFYQYTKKGYIPSTDKKIQIADLQTWYDKYSKKTTPTKKVNLTDTVTVWDELA